MKTLDQQVSYFTSTTKPCFKIESAPEGKQFVHFSFKNGSLLTLFENIGKGKWKDLLAGIKTQKGGYDKNKTKLPCFTPSGVFRIRNDYDLLKYSHIVHLDYDKVEQPEKLKERLAKSPHTLAAFISPSGKGLKVFVVVNTTADLHTIAFTQVKKIYDQLAEINSDPTARNISRLCYLSYDKNVYINREAKVFEVTDNVKNTIVIPDASILAGTNDVFSYLFNLTMKGKFQGEMFAGYELSNRNKFIYLFACNCNRYGIDKVTAHEYAKSIWIQNNEGFSQYELTRTVNSAYSHVNEFGTYKLPKSLAA